MRNIDRSIFCGWFAYGKFWGYLNLAIVLIPFIGTLALTVLVK